MHQTRSWPRIAAFAASIALASAGAAFASSDEHKHEHGKSEAKLVLDHGKKWRTDEAARRGMENVRAAIAVELKAIHAGTLSDAQYGALAKKVNDEVAAMVRDCKLDPKADAQFHIVIAELMEGAENMEGKRKGDARRKGAERTVRALNDYGRYFEHPGWRRI